MQAEIKNSLSLGAIFTLVLAYMELGNIAFYLLLGLSFILIAFSVSCAKSFRIIVLTSILLTITVLLSLIRGTGLSVFDYCLNTIIGVSIAIFFLRHSFNVVFLRVIFILVSIYLIYKCIVFINSSHTYDDAFFEGSHSSTNYISVYLLGFLAVIYLIERRQNVSSSIWLPLLCLLASFFGLNRSGILCSSVFCLLIFCEKLKNKYIVISTFTVLAILYFAFQYYFGYLIDFIDLIEAKEDFAYVENPRYEILNAYLSQLSVSKLFLGQDISRISLISAFNNNPHNSYVILFATCGVLAFFYVYLIIKALVWYLKHDKFLAGAVVVLLLRAWFDMVYCGKIFDFAIIAFILYPLFSKKKASSLILFKNSSIYTYHSV